LSQALFYDVVQGVHVTIRCLWRGLLPSQGNTSLGTGALQNNTTGNFNTAIGLNALFSNTTGCPLFTYYPVSVVAKSLSILLVLKVQNEKTS
jgi:hypothetical protein